EVFQAGLHAPIIFAGDEHESVGLADLARQRFQRRRRRALRMLLVHAVEHREIDRLGIDQLDVATATLQPLHHEMRQPDSHPVGPVRAVEDEDAGAHDVTAGVARAAGGRSLHRPPCKPLRQSLAYFGNSLPACSRTMYSAYQSGHASSCTPVCLSCSPCAAAARRSAAASSAAELNSVLSGLTRPGSRWVTSCSSQKLASGSVKVASDE